jgi:hypothetical protein
MATIMGELEKMLAQWMGRKYQGAFPLSTMIIQVRAKSFFDELNALDPGPKMLSFAASSG